MKLSGFREMDPYLLVGLVNTELRDYCESLDELALKHGIDCRDLEERLDDYGFSYLPEVNQFR